uniref:LAGLIDADG endonuclease n=2 Tax=Monilinia fructicola TaxID=38448 RepID=A0A889XPR2_MONFR|nr:LAGLIDADG endonuclease [Monilinia fructicola]QRF72252.1 LAGLIDADG endonuclease [Monilinia fructicola]
MGNRGSKSDSYISVKEQRVDGYSVLKRYCKVYPKCQGNLVFIAFLKYVNTIVESIPGIQVYTKAQKSLFSIFTFANQKTLRTKGPARFCEFSSSINGLNPYYITGFTDGEGCFFVGVSPDSKSRTGYRVKANFQIGLHLKDLALLEQIKLFFGVGKISKLGAESVQFRVYALEDLKVILHHFDKYPLLTNKQSDYLLFKQVVNLMEEGKHLTLEGLNKIMSIKTVLNNGEVSDNLRLAFPNVEPILKPEIKDRTIKSLHWLAGFTDAEGCFFVALKKSPASKLGEAVWLRFILTQHTRDEDFLKSLVSTLNCGRYIPKSGYGEFIVEKFTDVSNKVIPIFEEFKLHGIKSKNFEDFQKVALLMENKVHLTREGLDEIKKIKGGMNKNRLN